MSDDKELDAWLKAQAEAQAAEIQKKLDEEKSMAERLAEIKRRAEEGK